MRVWQASEWLVISMTDFDCRKIPFFFPSVPVINRLLSSLLEEIRLQISKYGTSKFPTSLYFFVHFSMFWTLSDGFLQKSQIFHHIIGFLPSYLFKWGVMTISSTIQIISKSHTRHLSAPTGAKSLLSASPSIASVRHAFIHSSRNSPCSNKKGN